jgi:hypothetical protein
MELIYHYTSGQHLELILEKGELIVSEWERKNKVKPPALWLSLNPIWENTATKNINDNGIARRLTKNEQHEKFGLIRFVLEFKKDNLCSWARYKHKSNTPFHIYKSMEEVGIKQGANPNEWFACFKNIPLEKCISCQKWNGVEWETIIDFSKA